MLVSVESNTETLLWYENPSFPEYTAVERNTTCRTIKFCPKSIKEVSHRKASDPPRALTQEFNLNQLFNAGVKMAQNLGVPRLKRITADLALFAVIAVNE